MTKPQFVNATDIVQWANRRDAQGLLPQLVRRMILASAAHIEKIHFRSQEGIQLGGWDGVAIVESGNAFVPDGVSVWEAGTESNSKSKADEDYHKRTADPLGIQPKEATFIFVTPRRWSQKEKWQKERRAENVWRDVRVYDADDLETWLELVPNVHTWFSLLLGKNPSTMISLETYWEEWKQNTCPATTAEFVIAGRQEDAEKINQYLNSSPSVLVVVADSQEEALAFICAVLDKFSEPRREVLFTRSLVIKDPNSWQQGSTAENRLILIPLFTDNFSRAIQNGHHVLVPLGKEYTQDSHDCLILSRRKRPELLKALKDMGIPDKKIDELATLARLSFPAFRRKIAVSPSLQHPAWATPNEARAILPVILIGMWNETYKGDREIIAQLMGKPYEEVSQVLTRWANESDPPIRRTGEIWMVVSKEDAWSLLSHMLTPNDMERFEKVVIEVLGTKSPALQLPADRRWAASLYGLPPRHSQVLRTGLADTLAFISAKSSQSNTWLPLGTFVTRIIKRLLFTANEDHEGLHWTSLSDVLPLLSEAAPDTFLNAIDDGLAGETPVLGNLFNDSQATGFLFSNPTHTGLLWALENLAWYPDYLGRVSLQLARLHTIDPGGKWLNRPINGLYEIFSVWPSQTLISKDQHLRIIDQLRDREPRVAWELLVGLLTRQGFAQFSRHSPRWREWFSEEKLEITYAELDSIMNEWATRLVEDVRTDIQKWQGLIAHFASLPLHLRDQAIELLTMIDFEEFNPQERVLLQKALKDLIFTRRKFRGGGLLLEYQVDKLEQVCKRLEPSSVIHKHVWLFSNNPYKWLDDPDDRQGSFHQLREIRKIAVHEIFDTGGLPLLLQMSTEVERSFELGLAMGETDFFSRDENRFLQEYLATSNVAHANLARGYIMARFKTEQWNWVDNILKEIGLSLSPIQRACLFCCLPTNTHTWSLVRQFDSETEREYWIGFNPYFPDEPSAFAYVARMLTQYGRPHIATQVIHDAGTKGYQIEPDLIINTLLQSTEVQSQEQINWGEFQHHAMDLLDYLERFDPVNETQLASLEWRFLPLLRFSNRPPKLLHLELSRNPQFFVEAVSRVYKSEDEEPKEITVEEQRVAEQGYELLNSWKRMPGMAEDGTVDPNSLKLWVTQARESLVVQGRAAIGDHHIGKALRYGPTESGNTWPHEAICHIIESVASTELEQGFEHEVYVSRGVVKVTGGQQEKELADRYNAYATKVSDKWPRTAAMLRRIANHYLEQAHRDALEAELREDIGR